MENKWERKKTVKKAEFKCFCYSEFNSERSFLHHLRKKHKMIKGNEEGAEEEGAEEEGADEKRRKEGADYQAVKNEEKKRTKKKH